LALRRSKKCTNQDDEHTYNNQFFHFSRQLFVWRLLLKKKKIPKLKKFVAKTTVKNPNTLKIGLNILHGGDQDHIFA